MTDKSLTEQLCWGAIFFGSLGGLFGVVGLENMAHIAGSVATGIYLSAWWARFNGA